MNAKPLPEIHVDWNDNFGANCIALDSDGSQLDIREQGIVLREGLRVRLYGDASEAEAVIRPFELNQHTFFVAEIIEGTFREVQRNPLKP